MLAANSSRGFFSTAFTSGPLFPTSTSSSSSSLFSSSSSIFFREYIWRIFNWHQLDFELTFSIMFDLLRSPSEVYKSTAIRKQIKNQWARDDPAFIVVLSLLLLAGSLAWTIYLGIGGNDSLTIFSFFRTTFGIILIEFLGFGMIVATCLRFYINRSMRVQRLYSTEQEVEWLYAFDIHCNSFFPVFVLLVILQYFLSPILLSQTDHTNSSLSTASLLVSGGQMNSGEKPGEIITYKNNDPVHSVSIPVTGYSEFHFFSTLLANTLYTLAFCYYNYVTFLGYSQLPFLHHSERLLYPIALILIFYFLALIMNFNIATFVIGCYFNIQK